MPSRIGLQFVGALIMFSVEALKLGALLERLGEPVSRECYDKLSEQCAAEVPSRIASAI